MTGPTPLEKPIVTTPHGGPSGSELNNESFSLGSRVPIPQISSAPDPERVRNWIQSELDPRFRALKQKIADHINHVPFAKFQDALHITTTQVNSLIAPDEKYAVLWDSKPHSSKRWVYEQIKNTLAHPATIETYYRKVDESQPSIPKIAEIARKGVDTYVIFDDASYSGIQLTDMAIRQILLCYKGERPSPNPPKIIIAVPYITEAAFKKMSSQIDYPVVKICYSEKINDLGEILDSKDWELLKERQGEIDIPGPSDPWSPESDKLEKATLTYFDHRMPDSYSFSYPVRRALKLSAVAPYRDESHPYYLKEETEYSEFTANF